MDDYSLSSLTESKNEWCARLVSILSHNIIQGINSIYDEAVKLCIASEQENKYLMTFQNLLSRIPTWNPTTIEVERNRIETSSGCKYLEDLITCVHIIQLKALTCIRVGLKQKKIDINIPSIDKFIHQIYINTARKLYTNIYLFEKDLYPLQIQKNNRELEGLVKEAILTTIRDNVPVEQILRAYMDETEEQEETVENVNVEKVNVDPVKDKNELGSSEKSNIINDMSNNVTTEEKLDAIALSIPTSDNKSLSDTTLVPPADELSIDFSDIDSVIDSDGNKERIPAPKDLETLEKIAIINNQKRAQEESEEDDNTENVKLNIGEDVKIHMDTINLNSALELDEDPLLDDVELL